MSIIYGIDKLQGNLTIDQINQLEKAADKHQSQSNISFTLLLSEGNTLEIETTQGENKSGKYANETTLIQRTKEVFGKLPSEFQIKVIPITYLPSPASAVNPAWLEKKMEQKGVRIKQIAFETGVDRESISDWVTGKRSMSQIVKAMFYFYLSR